ncbi:unnamed protein product [Schistosoma curassoni]|uniref:Uncharacterized protein n=1 Tax=Schistosoma curassoni TaxID=6186 RepID=A0A183KSN3_9TREM|nr:unnamed protein product [Schistosoma curassoni]
MKSYSISSPDTNSQLQFIAIYKSSVPIIPKLLLNKELIETNCTHGNCSHSTIHTIDNYNPHIKIGILFTVKPLVQFLVNPFIGPITNRYSALALSIYAFTSASDLPCSSMMSLSC